MVRTFHLLASCAVLLPTVSACAAESSPPGFVTEDAGVDAYVRDVGVDAGPGTLTATIGTNAAPTGFAPPTVTSYKTGYTVIQGQAVLPAMAPYVLPTVGDLTLKLPSALGTVSCDTAGTTEVELDEDFDSNANIRQTGTTTDGIGTCSITVTTFDGVGGRIAGSFTAHLVTGDLNGTFDVPRGPDQS